MLIVLQDVLYNGSEIQRRAISSFHSRRDAQLEPALVTLVVVPRDGDVTQPSDALLPIPAGL